MPLVLCPGARAGPAAPDDWHHGTGKPSFNRYLVVATDQGLPPMTTWMPGTLFASLICWNLFLHLKLARECNLRRELSLAFRQFMIERRQRNLEVPA